MKNSNMCIAMGPEGSLAFQLARQIGKAPVSAVYYPGNPTGPPDMHAAATKGGGCWPDDPMDSLMGKFYSTGASTIVVESNENLLRMLSDFERAYESILMLAPDLPPLSVYVVTKGESLKERIVTATSSKKVYVQKTALQQADDAVSRIDMQDPEVAAMAAYFGVAPKADGTKAPRVAYVDMYEDEKEVWVDPAPTPWYLDPMLQRTLETLRIVDAQYSEHGFSLFLLVPADGEIREMAQYLDDKNI